MRPCETSKGPVGDRTNTASHTWHPAGQSHQQHDLPNTEYRQKHLLLSRCSKCKCKSLGSTLSRIKLKRDCVSHSEFHLLKYSNNNKNKNKTNINNKKSFFVGVSYLYLQFFPLPARPWSHVITTPDPKTKTCL